MKLSGWGRYPVHEAELAAPRDRDELARLIAQGGVIARGNGRAYGDSAVGARTTVDMRHFNRMLAFDETTGQLTVEAGVLLGDIIAAFLPRGWFPLVTPGTRFVTVGGMIAADVHGKNQHRDGSFGTCLDWIELVDATGTLRRCSPDEQAELFRWTVGGMGLTGIVVRAALRLRRVTTGWIRQTMLPAANLRAALEAFESAPDATYSVAWIDCQSSGDRLGRSLVMLGEHAGADELTQATRADPFALRRRRQRSVPFAMPSFLLNSLTVRAFNEAYYRNGRRQAGTRLVDWDSYFYPLDAVLHWNRIYGRRGFVQYQCVLPGEAAEAGLTALLADSAASGRASFLAVLKRFGPQESAFSFPMEGYTLALDFPLGRDVLELLDRLDRIVLDHGGRLYLAKDARMARETLFRSDPRAEQMVSMRRKIGAADHFSSMQSVRLGL